jgi:hypothetical protein
MPWAPSNKAQAASAIIAGFALIAAGFGGAMAWMSYHGSTTITQLKTEAELKGSSDTLQRRFKDFGIDDVNALSDFLYLLGKDDRANAVTHGFYETQIRQWCRITRPAHDKLKIMWTDNTKFREPYANERWYLEMLDRLAGQSSDTKGDCL